MTELEDGDDVGKGLLRNRRFARGRRSRSRGVEYFAEPMRRRQKAIEETWSLCRRFTASQL